jgi:hypothetical protein
VNVPAVRVEEEHYTEGELDLEPPEELAIGEFDEAAQLEEELDNEDVDEQDVDETVLEETLDDLLRAENGDEDDESALDDAWISDVTRSSDDDGLDLLEVEDLEDLEESLDRILSQRTASDDEDFERDPLARAAATTRQLQSRQRQPRHVPQPVHAEFVCRSCFLVRNTSQLADTETLTCHDCSR